MTNSLRLIPLLYVLALLWIFSPLQAQQENDPPSIDILHYEAFLEPAIASKSLQGWVKIRFSFAEGQATSLSLNCGDLVIDRVQLAKAAIPFKRKNRRLIVDVSDLDTSIAHEVEIHYHGTPRRGIQFFPDVEQVYTVFTTSEWMPCRDAAEDRATFDLHLLLPKGLDCVGNGYLKSKEKNTTEKVQYTWTLSTAVPSYIFGFVIGHFNAFVEQYDGLSFRYLSADYTSEELQQIFAETVAMYTFLKEKAGQPYPGTQYTQILTKGNISQEMADFAVLRNNYGKQILERPQDVNLGAHELAHQWWGNQVTCKNWRHFWLNEGLAVFMSSAFKEARYGREAYLADIDIYYNAYQGVVKKGLDKPLVFPNWNNPTADDRTLVYYKGAYFFHVLRERLGDEAFWAGIRLYTTIYFGESVVSSDLQEALEQTSGTRFKESICNLGV